MSKKIIIGNWKMNPIIKKEAEKLFSIIAKNVSNIKRTEIVIAPPFVYLEKLKKISKKIILGAQNAGSEEVGAFTGEVSPVMLENMGVKYVILGHSERRVMPARQSFGVGGGETNADINQKVKTALSAGLLPILCVGENHRDENHEYFNFVKTQILECLAGVSKNLFPKIIIAYEPVWAISSTVNRHDATPHDSLEMSIFIRKVLSDISSPAVAGGMRIIYGGSVNERDAGDFLMNGGVDGLLVGRASLNVKKFVEIVKIAENIK